MAHKKSRISIAPFLMARAVGRREYLLVRDFSPVLSLSALELAPTSPDASTSKDTPGSSCGSGRKRRRRRVSVREMERDAHTHTEHQKTERDTHTCVSEMLKNLQVRLVGGVLHGVQMEVPVV